MRATHETQMTCKCPVNGATDHYDVIFETTNWIKQVEELASAILEESKGEKFQEELTVNLRQRTGCKVTTVGLHGGFRTTVVCE